MVELEKVEKEMATRSLTPFNIGDTVKVEYRIVEGNKERLQAFEGIVIARKHGGLRENFVVRKIAAGGIGVERTFPIQSPLVDSLVVTRRGNVRRAKLYYLRKKIGKAAIVKEGRATKAAK